MKTDMNRSCKVDIGSPLGEFFKTPRHGSETALRRTHGLDCRGEGERHSEP